MNPYSGMEKIRIALAQINCTVGDLKGNCKKIIKYIQRAKKSNVDIISFPELTISGYPPEDLLFKTKYISDNLKELGNVTKDIDDIVAIVGFVNRKNNSSDLYNAAAVMYNHKIYGIYHKMFLPNYGVFDEKRYFKAGDSSLVFKFSKFLFSVAICEDIWYKDGPIKQSAMSGAGLIFSINASPYYAGRIKERERVICNQAKSNNVFIIYNNLVGGQDELVFDGQSMVINPEGKIISRAKVFEEDLLIVDLDIPTTKVKTRKKLITITNRISSRNKTVLSTRAESEPLTQIAEIYQALVLGLRDYVEKNGFQKVVIGLSGGIDSSLVAVLAVDALGKDNVFGVFMPSRYSSQESRKDAEKLAGNLGIPFKIIPIEGIYKIYLQIMKLYFKEQSREGIAFENLQARIRGNILMFLSNKFGWLVLTTGNKSEMSTGYATLYGDMAGGFSVIKDVPKILVYRLCRHRDSLSKIIPESVFTKEPTAELKPNQRDSDTLPSYETLDPILKAYIEEDKELTEIVGLGFDRETVSMVLNMVDKNEYKRRQSPPGIKITPRAFGKDRRMPITNKYRG